MTRALGYCSRATESLVLLLFLLSSPAFGESPGSQEAEGRLDGRARRRRRRVDDDVLGD